ncbi:unnamed protein product [Taenia asiatica]|uniref:Uncharacterized protein n=1 Tax=Taenia asiatica TaxID=60517 RepID=A0A0R3WGQ4_TAEAS|nr:unnamed protein product [Taenia asiatica]
MRGRDGGDKSGGKAEARSARVCRLLRRGSHAGRVDAGALVYLVVVLVRSPGCRGAGVTCYGGAAAKEDREVGSHRGVSGERDNGSPEGHHKEDC